jgi:uncharacterized damage-inducible protein DinB
MPSFRSLLVLALLPAAALPASAQQFLPKSTMTSIIESQKRYLLRVIDAAPDSMLGFRPTPGVRTFAEQVEHAAGADAFIARLVITGGTQGMPVLGDSLVFRKNKAALKEFATKSMDHAVEMIKGVSDEDMMKDVVLFGNTMPRFRALMLLLDHFPWTVGQVVPYLRLNGVTPPAYSPF